MKRQSKAQKLASAINSLSVWRAFYGKHDARMVSLSKDAEHDHCAHVLAQCQDAWRRAVNSVNEAEDKLVALGVPVIGYKRA